MMKNKWFKLKYLHILSLLVVTLIFVLAAVSYIEQDTAYLKLGNFTPLEIGRCRTKEMIGRDCPTCGYTRSLISILSFDIPAALRYNVFGVFVFLGFLSLGLGNVLALLKRPFANKLLLVAAFFGVVSSVGAVIRWLILTIV